MVELTRSSEPVIRELRHWDQEVSPFLTDTLKGRISFFRSDTHFSTSRARVGQNPEILSVIRLLVKAFQYELSFSDTDFTQLKLIIDEFDPRGLTDPTAIHKIQETAKKLVMHATNIEYAMNRLDELGLRQKLIALGDPGQRGSSAWWLNREPLRSKSVGLGDGATAETLGLHVVAHETLSFLAFESITRSHSGQPNVLISREGAVGEVAAHGDGFYTRVGRVGAKGTGLTIRFSVDPRAREDTDFVVHGDYIIFRNKNALRVIQESLNFSLDDLIHLKEESLSVDRSDLALLEKLKRKLNSAGLVEELERLLCSSRVEDYDRLVQLVQSPLISSANLLLPNEVIVRLFSNLSKRFSQPDARFDYFSLFQSGFRNPKIGKMIALEFGAHRPTPHVRRSIRKLIEAGDGAAISNLVQYTFSQSHAVEMKDLIRALIEKGDAATYFALGMHVFSQPHAAKLKDLIPLMIKNGDVVAALRAFPRYVFSQPHAVEMKDLIRLTIETRDFLMLQELAQYTFSQPHTAEMRDLIRLTIEKGSAATLLNLASLTFSQPHTAEMEDLIRLTIEKGDTVVLQSLAAHTFSQPHAASMKDLIRLLIEKDDVTTIYALARSISSQPHAAETKDLFPLWVLKGAWARTH